MTTHDVYFQSGDWRVIGRGIELAQELDEEIDDRTAKVIAAQLHDGSSAALAFASTGAIVDRPSDVWRAFTHDYYEYQPEHVRLALDFLGTYLHARAALGQVGPVVGWHDLNW